eukprot:1159221-Pelagomonas_calceolata.AAC.20
MAAAVSHMKCMDASHHICMTSLCSGTYALCTLRAARMGPGSMSRPHCVHMHSGLCARHGWARAACPGHTA